MRTYVLVHGAWHGAWCWHKIVARLETRGHRAIALDMPNHGRDRSATNDVSLTEMVERVGAAIEREDEPVVLVGHSFGGTIITQTAERYARKIHALVYVTAIVPSSGQNSVAATEADTDSLLPGSLTISADGKKITGTMGDLREIFYAQCSDEDVELAKSLLVPESMAALVEPVVTTAENWGSIERIYVECLRDRAISVAQQRRFQEAVFFRRVVSLDTDHSPYFSMPDALVAILAEL